MPLPGLGASYAPAGAGDFCGREKTFHLMMDEALRQMTASGASSLEFTNDMSLILLIVILLLVFGSVPTWGHSRNWGYGPSGGLGLILVILLILYLTNHLNF